VRDGSPTVRLLARRYGLGKPLFGTFGSPANSEHAARQCADNDVASFAKHASRRGRSTEASRSTVPLWLKAVGGMPMLQVWLLA